MTWNLIVWLRLCSKTYCQRWKYIINVMWTIDFQRWQWILEHALKHHIMYCNKSIFDFSEKPNDEEWLSLNRMKIPLLLNYAQCKLLNKEYYSVIEHCTTVLNTESGIQIYYGIIIRLHKNISRILSSFFYS